MPLAKTRFPKEEATRNIVPSARDNSFFIEKGWVKKHSTVLTHVREQKNDQALVMSK
jgi:hypothetical protein